MLEQKIKSFSYWRGVKLFHWSFSFWFWRWRRLNKSDLRRLVELSTFNGCLCSLEESGKARCFLHVPVFHLVRAKANGVICWILHGAALLRRAKTQLQLCWCNWCSSRASCRQCTSTQEVLWGGMHEVWWGKRCKRLYVKRAGSSRQLESSCQQKLPQGSHLLCLVCGESGDGCLKKKKKSWIVQIFPLGE